MSPFFSLDVVLNSSNKQDDKLFFVPQFFQSYISNLLGIWLSVLACVPTVLQN